MAGYQAIGGTPYGQNYGQNYQNYAQQISSKYSTPNTTEKLSSLDCYSNNQFYSDISNSNKIDKKRQKKTALWITGGLLVTSTVAALVLSKGKNGTIWGKLKSGAKTCWEKTKNFFSAKPKTNELGDTVLDTVEMIQKNGRTTLRLPEATQTLTGKTDTITSAAKDLGIDSVAKELTGATSKVKTSRMIIEDNGVKKLVTLGNSGNVFCKTLDGKTIKLAEQSDEFQKIVKETVDSIKSNKFNNLNSKVKIENIVYDSEIVDGTVGTYLHKGSVVSGSSGVKRVITDRFDVDSDVVWQQMKHNSKLKKAIKEAVPIREHWYSLPISADYSRWKIRTATHTPKMKNWPNNAQILIENNKIVGVIENGVRVDTTRFEALQERFPKAFEDVLDKKLDNVIRYL